MTSQLYERHLSPFHADSRAPNCQVCRFRIVVKAWHGSCKAHRGLHREAQNADRKRILEPTKKKGEPGQEKHVRKCPRCKSSMLTDQEAVLGSSRAVWKCIGCGREILQDLADQEEDARFQEKLAAHILGHHAATP